MQLFKAAYLVQASMAACMSSSMCLLSSVMNDLVHERI